MTTSGNNPGSVPSDPDREDTEEGGSLPWEQRPVGYIEMGGLTPGEGKASYTKGSDATYEILDDGTGDNLSGKGGSEVGVGGGGPLGRSLIVLISVVIITTLALGAVAPLRVAYYALAPGPSEVTGEHVSVTQGEPQPGDLVFLTVSIREATLYDYVAGMFNDEIELEPIERYVPAGVDQEELDRQNDQMMRESQMTATYVALDELGYDVTYSGSGAQVTGVMEGSAAEGVILEGDIIEKVDGVTTEFSQDVVDELGQKAPGDEVELQISRPAEDGPEALTINVVLGSYRYVDEDTGEEFIDETKGMLGVLIETAGVNIEFPVDVEFSVNGIGGPSAGMMFTLEIINQLTSQDITKGLIIAGTGTIGVDGEVGPIGGMQQKTYGAIDSGASLLLVPRDNYEEAFSASDGKITVVAIDDIEDALRELDALQYLEGATK